MRNDARAAWEQHAVGLTQFAESYTKAALERGCDSARNQKLIRKLELVADNEIGRMYDQIRQMTEEEQEKWMPDCRAGCSHCCYQVVGVAVPELLSFVDYIRENCCAEEIERIKRGAAEYGEAYRSTPVGIRPMFACPVLVDDRCGAYEGRCLVCRGYHSLDVNVCIELKEHPEKQIAAPGIKEMFSVAMNIRTGMRRALKEQGLDSDLIVLGLGLEIALNDPEAGDKYFRGENVFAEARLRQEYMLIV